jgi:UDP-glucose 4-epimerase
MRIILLGGGGFIGQHFASFCQSLAEVVVVSRRSPSPKSRLANVTYLQGDCGSEKFLLEVIHAGDQVVYLAHNSIPQTSFKDPLLDIKDNLPVAINLLNVIRKIPVKRLLYISSGGTVYGPTDNQIPISEGHSTNPISPYGITKLAIENYCRMYARIFEIPVVIARPSNPFGPGQIPDRGQGFIATAVAKILLRQELPVFGNFGTIRDYIYIHDLCAAMKILLDSSLEPGTVFNIGSEVGMNNLEVIQSIATSANVAQSDIKLSFLPARSFDVPFNVLNTYQLRTLGWRPKVDFEAGLSSTIHWVREFLNTK